MLGKLLKHEFRAISAPFGMALGIYAIAMMFYLVARAINHPLILGVMSFIFLMMTFALPILTIVILIRRTYETLVGRGAYLTYTIPVGIHTLIIPKLISFVMGILASFVVILGGAYVLYRTGWQQAGLLFTNESSTAILSMVLLNVVLSSMTVFFGFSLVNLPALRERNAGIPVAIVAGYVLNQVIGLLVLLILIVTYQIGKGNGLDVLNADPIEFVQSLIIIESIVMVFLMPVVYMISTRILAKHRQIQ